LFIFKKLDIGIAVRNDPEAFGTIPTLVLGSEVYRTVRRYLYFPNKLGLTVFYTLN